MTKLDLTPRPLRQLSAVEIKKLDPYMAAVIGNRKSGRSLNNIIGCVLDCGYCVRHFWGNFDTKIPVMVCPTEQAVIELIQPPDFIPDRTPIQLYNKATDPFLPAVKPHLFKALSMLDERELTNPVLVITRFTVTEDDMAFLENLRHVKLTLLFTYSGITDERIEPIAKSSITIKSIETACAHKNRTKVIVYWRPIVPGWNDAPETMASVIHTASDADALVFTGYYHKDENAAFLKGLGVELPYSDDDTHRRKTMPAELDARVVQAWKDSGTAVPLFRKTSCGVSYAHGMPDYNGHLGVPSLCDICPDQQVRLCQAHLRQPTETEFAKALHEHGHRGIPFRIDDGHIWVDLPEQQRYPLMHRFGYQMWSPRTPHYDGAHGRSLLGHDPSPHELALISEIRAAITSDLVFDGTDD